MADLNKPYFMPDQEARLAALKDELAQKEAADAAVVDPVRTLEDQVKEQQKVVDALGDLDDTAPVPAPHKATHAAPKAKDSD